jgi:chromosome segregation ATPase
LALPDLQRQRDRESEARDDLKKRQEHLAAARIEAEEASARLEVLRDTVGAKVEELQRQLADADAAVQASEGALKRARSPE